MAIDPKILARMQNAPPQDDGSEGALFDDDGPAEPEKPLPADRHSGCATLTGTWKQRKWAIDLRNVTLDLKWPEAVFDRLKRITDSTWWIANRNIVKDMKYKEPALSQMHTGSGARQLPAREMAALKDMSNMIQRDEQTRERRADDERFTDAEKWAESVSQNPKLAKAAILAVLSRLYKDGNLKTRMRNASRTALAKAEAADAKDIDAIERMLL